MKSGRLQKLKSVELVLQNTDHISKSQSQKFITKISSSQRKYGNSESPSKKNLISFLKSQENTKLKPILTLKDLQLKKVAQSSRPSPTKFYQSKKNLQLLTPTDLTVSTLRLPEITHSLKLHNRRTQSTVNDHLLLQVPLNFVNRCIFKTKVGSQNGKNKKENQDSFIIHQNFQGMPGNYLFSVCDGHGIFGHKVSRYIKNHFVNFLELALQERKNTENMFYDSYLSTVKKIEDLFEPNDIDTNFSGSTIVSVIIQGNLLTCANIGDSRAVLGKKIPN